MKKPPRGGSEASKKKVVGEMKKDLEYSDEVRRLLAEPPKRQRSPPAAGVAMPGGEGKKPRIAKPPTPPKGRGKPKLMNQQGKAHRGAFHQMEDGSYHSGATHTKRSKLLKLAE